MVVEILSSVRTISHLLHPPLLDETGLPPALRWYVEEFAERSGIKVVLLCPAHLKRLPRELETAIFRIVQECLGNVHRHSGSATAAVYFDVADAMAPAWKFGTWARGSRRNGVSRWSLVVEAWACAELRNESPNSAESWNSSRTA
jgi:hypothetical protein